MRSSQIAFLGAVLAASAAFAANPVLRVNDALLTDVDLKLAKGPVAQQMQGMHPTDEVVLRHAVDSLIGRTLLLQAALEAKATVDPKAVAASMEEERTRAGGPEAFAKQLAGLGITEQDLAKIEEQAQLVRKYVEAEIAPKATVTDADAKAYFDANPKQFQNPEQVKLRVLMVAVKPGSDEKEDATAKARAEDAYKRVVGGEDFAKVAQEVSGDPSKARGGEIGWVRKGLLRPELEAPVWALKAGEVSSVLKANFGYYIFKVDERRLPGSLSFEEVKPRLLGNLKNEKIEATVRMVVAERRAKAKIDVLDPALKAALESAEAQVKPMTGAAKPAPTAQSGAAPTPKPVSDVPKQP
ncbi:MAG: peptidylprolyl isomerase [Thermoanaerobaculaceae bacterium]|jgi:peptidyl-prolyl cis-trans isomerase C